MIPAELNVDRAALLLLDVQKAFLNDANPFIRSGLIPSISSTLAEFESNVASVLNAMRQAGRPIFFINTTFRADHADCYFSPEWKKCVIDNPGLLVEGTVDASVIDELAPRENEFIIIKKGHSAFQFTHLDRALADLHVNTCVVAGNVLSSVEETLRQGAALGYENILVSDASFPVRFPLLKTLGSRTFDVPTPELLDWIKQERRSTARKEQIKPCLLVIDIQNDFIHPEGVQTNRGAQKFTEAERQEIIGNNLKLLNVMRRKGFPIIYVKSLRGKDRLIDTASAKAGLRKKGMEYRTDGTWGAEIVAELTPQPSDYIVGKRGHSAFGTTHLHRMLRNLGVNFVIVTGGSVVGCVADSTREGVGLGYRMALVGDATYPPEKRELAFPALASRLEIRTTDEMIAWLDQGQFETGQQTVPVDNQTSGVGSQPVA
ncbi:MAG TPA: isochorismatase family cysteine hydrolase [Gammaproteobacteria bacterium]|nr:isochorismatase family cysteine hydrolase [Gammaproteobacteria bacterium]